MKSPKVLVQRESYTRGPVQLIVKVWKQSNKTTIDFHAEGGTIKECEDACHDAILALKDTIPKKAPGEVRKIKMRIVGN